MVDAFSLAYARAFDSLFESMDMPEIRQDLRTAEMRINPMYGFYRISLSAIKIISYDASLESLILLAEGIFLVECASLTIPCSEKGRAFVDLTVLATYGIKIVDLIYFFHVTEVSTWFKIFLLVLPWIDGLKERGLQEGQAECEVKSLPLLSNNVRDMPFDFDALGQGEFEIRNGKLTLF